MNEIIKNAERTVKCEGGILNGHRAIINGKKRMVVKYLNELKEVVQDVYLYVNEDLASYSHTEKIGTLNRKTRRKLNKSQDKHKVSK